MPRAVILTALPVEYLAVRSHLRDLQEEVHPQGTIYERGTFTAPGQTWDVGIVEIGAGNTGAALEAERAIAHFRPDVILFVGVAGGIRDVALGDVVASTKIYGYESGKAEEGFKPRPEIGLSDYGLEQRARVESRKTDWLKRLSSLPSPKPNVLVAPLAAGEKVIASRKSEIFQFLRSNYGDAVAVEMEGFGFLDTVHANQRISALVIRGISDLIDDKSNSDENSFQDIAARHASAFSYEILAKYNKIARVSYLSKKRTFVIIFLTFVFLLAATTAFYLRQITIQPSYLDLLNTFNVNEIVTNIVPIKQEIDHEREMVDTLQEGKDDAIAFYESHLESINQSMIHHRTFIMKVSEIIDEGKSTTLIDKLSEDIESKLGGLVHKYRIPYLVNDLVKNKPPRYGKLIPNSHPDDLPDKQFEKGALLTTYEIIMPMSKLEQPFGLGADLNNDGKIQSSRKTNNYVEASQIPCETLKDIEILWEKTTKNSCSWYGKDPVNPHFDIDCLKLNIHPTASTLSGFISLNYPDEIVERVKSCEKKISFDFNN